jgi:tRNA A37 threonylcarbamoyladenosine dehydratase
MNRAFEGIENLYSKQGLKNISNCHFLVVGIGGVGSWICESLARSGALKITIVDMDSICVSNINRQIHSLTTTVGESKTSSMASRLKLINPQIEVIEIFDFFTSSTAAEILDIKYDYVFDAIDSLKSKCVLINECKKRDQRVITIGAAGGKRNSSLITVKDLNRTDNDKLLSSMRKELKRDFGFWKFHDHPYRIAAVFSPELAKFSEFDDSKLSDKSISNCQTAYGSASFVTGTFAFIAVSYVLNEITDLNES